MRPALGPKEEVLWGHREDLCQEVDFQECLLLQNKKRNVGVKLTPHLSGDEMEWENGGLNVLKDTKPEINVK